MDDQPLDGPSDQPVISGDGNYNVPIRSNEHAFQGGIAQIVVERGGLVILEIQLLK